MLRLKANLKKRLSNAQRIAVLGIGSESRGDDAAGMAIARGLEEYRKNKRLKYLKVFFGHSAPENLTSDIRRFKPTHLIITDASSLTKKAGTVSLVEAKDAAGFSFSTHRLPVKILSDYLTHSIPCQVIILGITPKSLEFGTALSKEVKLCILQTIKLLKGLI